MSDLGFEEYQVLFDTIRGYGVPEHLIHPIEGAVNLLLVVLTELQEAEQQFQKSQVTIQRLRKSLFGKGQTLEHQESKDDSQTASDSGDKPDELPPKNNSQRRRTSTTSTNSKKPTGHGRLKADDYTGAQVHQCHHSHLAPGSTCPLCERGKLYRVDPSVKVVVDGSAPLVATRYEIERLRCALCQAYFTANASVGVNGKYTASARAMLAIIHLWCGMTYYSLARTQMNMGMPVPSSTQSDLLLSSADPCFAVMHELMRLAANRDLILQDDTHAPIIELKQENREEQCERKGMYTSVFVSPGEQPIVLYFSGRNHAGENFDYIMKHRQCSEPITRMADAIAANTKHEAKSVNANCNAHAVTKLEDVVQYHQVCNQILTLYSQVFEYDAQCSAAKLNKFQRLALHQRYSAPLMRQILQLVESGLDTLEPNSVAYKELNYIYNHWHELSAFLRLPGVPLSNNYSERMLKSCIKYRKNSLRYNTCHSALAKATIMSVIATAYENKVNAHAYLTALLTYPQHVWQSPAAWLPWNYMRALARLTGCQSEAMAA